jgi:WD40-like Beta Propeller Repeat
MRCSGGALAWGVAVAVLAGATPPAQADVFEAAELVSQGFLPAGGASATEQAAYAHDPAISGDGRFLAFDGSFGGQTGVWRRDLQTGEIEPVAVGKRAGGGDLCEMSGSVQSPCDAELPSINGDGQYVSFTTAAPLAAHEDTNADPDVYVRNMDLEVSEQQGEACTRAEQEDAEDLTAVCPYTLVSAVEDHDEGLTYVAASGFGSVAGGRTAISADGQEIAFMTTAVSDLTDPQAPGAPNTPAMQVVVRNLETRQTLLVSERYDPGSGQAIPDEPVSGVEGATTYGAAFMTGVTPPQFPLAVGGSTLTGPTGASISADGSTVAWLGVNVKQQARTLPEENLAPEYAEPLWRRINEGPTTPTRRVTGGGDPESSACQASGETRVPEVGSLSDPCQGPFDLKDTKTGVWSGALPDDFVPQLSADGEEVAFLANGLLVSLGTNFGKAESDSNLYLANMQPGLTRVQALRPLTELAGAGEGSEAERLATTAPIVDFAFSPDGTQVAFTTKRTTFTLGTPTYISPTTPVPGMVELFDADLADETLTRVTEGFEGGPSAQPHKEKAADEDPYPIEDDGALSPSFSDDGNTLAFSSTAANLVYGDGNTPTQNEGGPFDGSDAFVVHREQFSSTATPESASPAPPNPEPMPEWRLGVSAQSLPNGSVRLYVTAPGPGKLHAEAQGYVIVRATKAASKHRATHNRRAHAKSSSTRAVVASVKRTLASANALARGGEGELLTLTLTLAPTYRSLASAHGGLSATVLLSFAAAGHPTLGQSLAVSFAASAIEHAKSRGHASSKHKRAGAR